jgi:transcriptional regulator with XRE-family HTH domain
MSKVCQQSVDDDCYTLWTAKCLQSSDAMENQQLVFGQWLRAHRTNKRMTVESLARKAGISKQYLSVLERAPKHPLTGKAVQPKVEIVDRIAKALGVSVDEARIAAGYAPQLLRPVSAKEAIELIRRMIPGFEGLLLSSGELTDERAEEILEDFRRIAKLHLRIGD